MVVVSSVAHTFSKVPINLDDLTFKRKKVKPMLAYAQSKVSAQVSHENNQNHYFVD